MLTIGVKPATIDIKLESLSCSLIKVVVEEVLGSLDINSKKLFAIMRHCIFKLIRIIVSTKSYEEWLNGKKMECDFRGVYVSAKFIDSDEGGKL